MSAPLHHLAAPTAGLACLTTAAAPSASPQLLNPGVSLGLAEAAALSAQISGQLAGMSTTEKAEGLKKAIEKGLKRFDEQQGPEVGVTYQLDDSGRTVYAAIVTLGVVARYAR